MVAVGIDLGTTRSAVAVIEGGQPRLISSSSGSRLTPSVVAMDKENNILVGSPATRQEAINPAGTVRSIKRRMGQKLPLQLPGGMYTPEDISGWILAQLKADAEAYLEAPVTDAVITVPAYFNDAQRHATAEAGALAGLNVLRIVNEPTAAALAYGLDKEQSATILVFDLGGGTFDVSLLTVGDGVVEVRATAGNNHLGGDDWDQAVVRWVMKKLGVEELDLHSMIRVREAAETAKISLSDATSTAITLPYLETPDGLKNFNEELTRAEFEKITAHLLEQVAEPMSTVMRDSELDYEEIDKVILVGGATRMPAVSSTVAKLTGIKPSKSVDPDEAVALGAAIQAGILAGTVKDILLLDVTSMSLGVATQGGLMAKIIERNTTIPTTQTETFTTVTDNQSTVRIDVYQGESDLADSNTKLATFELVGIPNAPRGVPQIDVTFDITANGMVEVSAKDRVSGLTRAIVVGPNQSSNKVSEDQLKTDKLRAEAIKSTQEQEEMVRYINKLLEEKRLPPRAVEAATVILKDLQGTDPSSIAAKKMMETLRTLAADTIDPDAEENEDN